MNMSMYSQAFLCSAASTYLMFVVLIVLSHKIDDDDACDSGLFVMPLYVFCQWYGRLVHIQEST